MNSLEETSRDNLHEMSKPIFKEKYFKMSSAEFFFYPACKALIRYTVIKKTRCLSPPNHLRVKKIVYLCTIQNYGVL